MNNTPHSHPAPAIATPITQPVALNPSVRLTRLLALLLLLAGAGSAAAQLTWTARESSRNWAAVASSADGTKLAAAADQGMIYTSTDSGATWTARSTAGTRRWRALASTASGDKLLAADDDGLVSGGALYLSTDYGATWTTLTAAGSRFWSAVAISADGSTLVAATTTGQGIFISSDNGATWAPYYTTGDIWWAGVAISKTGNLIVAAEDAGRIYTTTDKGATWATNSTDAGDSATTRGWTAVATSEDGSKFIASVGGAVSGYLYTYDNNTWTERTSAGLRKWGAVASSTNGANLVASVGNSLSSGFIHTSADSGATWTEQTAAASRKWRAVASSADGTKILAAVFGGQLYTGTPAPLNSAPTDITLSASSLAENVAANTTVGTLSTTDPDAGNTFTYTLVTGTDGTDNSAFTLTGSTLAINASPNFETKNSYTIRVRSTDQGALFFEKALTITVTDVNEAPTLTTVTALPGGTEDVALTISYATLAAAANAADVDGDTLSFRIEAVSGGTLTKGGSAVTPGTTLLGTGESLVWTPAADANGTLNAFTVKATDGTLASAAAVQVQVVVAAVNDPPTLTTVTALTGGTEDTALTITYATLAAAANEADVDVGDTLSFRIETLSGGTLTKGGSAVTPGTTLLGTGESLVWTPAANANGTLNAFTVKATDGTLASAAAVQVQVTVNAVNDAPTRTAGSVATLTVLEDAAATALGLGPLAYAAGPADEAAQTLTYTVTAVPASTLGDVVLTDGTTVVSANTTYTLAQLQGMKFKPAANANGGPATFSFTVKDNGGTTSGGVDTLTESLTVTATPVNDAPSGTNRTSGSREGPVTTLEDTAYTFAAADFGFSDNTDTPANALKAVKITTLPAAGGLANNGVAVVAGAFVSASDISSGQLKFTPATNANGTAYASFTFQVQDDGGTANGGVDLDASPKTLTLNVTPVNDPPSFALPPGSSVIVWGLIGFAPTEIPANLSGVTAIAAGHVDTVALKSDGTVVAWGPSAAPVPATLSGVTAIAAGATHTVALKSDGTVVAWGDNTSGQTTIPANLSGVTAIAAGGDHTVALKNDGTVVAWGRNAEGQTTIPATLSGVTAIAAGGAHTVALKNDGTVVAWGWNFSGQTTIPANLSGVTAIAAGGNHTVALGASQRDFILSFADGNISSGYHERDSFIASISGGPANEAHNGLRFNFSTDLPELFTEAPHFAGSDDTVQFTLASFKAGVATVTVTLTDDSTQGGPALTSAAETFTITVLGLGCPIVELLKPQPSPQSVSPQSLGLRVAADVAPAISLATFHALEGLLGDSAEGRRLKNLYRAHGTEIVQIMQAQPALRTQMTSVITSFQPLVVALLSGRAQQVQITQAMTDQLNVMWNTMTNFASPSLAGTLNTERTRFNGFQDFVGRDFSQWAAMLQVPAPTKPRVNISDIGRPTNGMLSLEANLVEGADVALWGSPDLINWSPVPGAVRQTNGFSLWLTDPNPSNLRRFYRLQTGP